MGKLNTVQNGKGSKNRITNYKSYIANFDNIQWSKKSKQVNNESRDKSAKS